MALFLTELKDGFLMLQFPVYCDRPAQAEWTATVDSWVKTEATGVILDLSKVQAIGTKDIRSIAAFHQELKKVGKSLHTIGVGKNVFKQIESAGMSRLFSMATDFADAKKKAAEWARAASESKVPQKSKIDVNFINPFIESTLFVLKEQCKCVATPSAPVLKKPDQVVVSDVCGDLKIESEEYGGSIRLSFDKAAFLAAYNGMLGTAEIEISTEVSDAAGELLNMISGRAKTKLAELNYKFERAIPTVIVGVPPKLGSATEAVLLLPFKTEKGSITMEISLFAKSIPATAVAS